MPRLSDCQIEPPASGNKLADHVAGRTASGASTEQYTSAPSCHMEQRRVQVHYAF